LPLHDQIAALLNAPQAKAARPIYEITLAEARILGERLAMGQGAPAEVAHVCNRYIDRPGGAIPVRLYKHESEATPEPVIVYLHGGGFVIGSLDSFDRVCRRIAATSGCAVLSVDYRLAPESPYPAANDDAYTVLQWVGSDKAASWGLDRTRIAMAGDSAGGTLVASAALRAQRHNGPAIRHQTLIYPAVDLTERSYLSKIENATGYQLTTAAVEWFYAQYLPDRSRAMDPDCSPLLALDLHGQPPATVITAEFDPLRDEGVAYAKALSAAGVPVEHIRMDGMIHGFLNFIALVADCSAMLDRLSLTIKAALRA
jgi:acetyl esterase